SHLQFLRDVIDRGFVQNVIYPPGYHWILALPTKIFHLDPYLVARYVGAFFGAGLVLAIYVLVKPLAGCSSALLSAFLMACFPGFYLLQKTGVGAFANQLGLFFIPTAFCFYIAKKEKALALSLMGLSVSVPMMLIHVLLTLAIAHLAFFIRERVDRWPRTGILALAVLPAILLLGLHFFQAGPVHQKATIVVITQGASTISAPSPSGKASEETDRVSSGNHPLMRLIRDFLSGKRLGFGNTGVNAIGCVLLILFVITIVGGIARGRPGLALLGFWGFIASLQTLTGVLQFSGYQREGWSLMIAVACLLGIIGGRVYDRGRGKRRVLFMTTAIVVAILSITGSFLYPPAHELRASCGEDELIRVVRNISSRYSEKSYLSITDKAVGAHPGSLLALSPRLPLTIITRKMTGWPGSNQGELVPTVIDPSDKLRVRTVPPGADLSAYLPQNGQHVVLLDKLSEDCLRNNVFFSFIDPRQVQNYLNDRQSYYKINDTILSYIDALDPNAWNIEENMFGNNLSVFTIVPTGRNP
ncbi:MAG: glycosyltransferase family 39 protein, partial [Syntrophaceae bacterium]|nr:glycosyltransferase family 39 protein [Syntrophaceae bacterium]